MHWSPSDIVSEGQIHLPKGSFKRSHFESVGGLVVLTVLRINILVVFGSLVVNTVFVVELNEGE